MRTKKTVTIKTLGELFRFGCFEEWERSATLVQAGE